MQTPDDIHVCDPEDMLQFNKLPAGLRRFLNDAPRGIPAAPVLEMYTEHVEALWEPWEAEVQVKNALTMWMQKFDGVKDFRPITPTKRKRVLR